MRLLVGQACRCDGRRLGGEIRQDLRGKVGRKADFPAYDLGEGAHKGRAVLALEQVAGRTRSQGLIERLFVGGQRQHDDFDGRRRQVNASRRLDAVAVRHVHVHQDQRRLHFRRQLLRLDPVVRQANDLGAVSSVRSPSRKSG